MARSAIPTKLADGSNRCKRLLVWTFEAARSSSPEVKCRCQEPWQGMSSDAEISRATPLEGVGRALRYRSETWRSV